MHKTWYKVFMKQMKDVVVMKQADFIYLYTIIDNMQTLMREDNFNAGYTPAGIRKMLRSAEKAMKVYLKQCKD